MSIDLYFIGNCKEIVTYPTVHSLSYGWGMDEKGAVRHLSANTEETPIVIDDSIVPPVKEELLAKLVCCCKHGCILDFERQYSPFHGALISSLRKAKIAPIWIPENYKKYCPEAIPLVFTELPHNSWKNYCISQHQQYRKGWALEYHPVQLSKQSFSPIEKKRTVLRDALCITETKNGQVTYYDTIETILEKLRIAEQYGCKGMIGIADEWHKLRKK